MSRAALWAAAIIGLGVHYVALATLFSFDLALVSKYGRAFDSMAEHLLQGRLDVDPATIGMEAFVRDGRSYAYFGIVPALLRLPLIAAVDLAGFPLETVSRVVAMAVAAMGQVATVLAITPLLPDRRVAGEMIPRLVLAAVASGPGIMLSLQPSIYNEAILWAWAFSAWFLAAIMPALVHGGRLSPARLAAAAVLAGLCFHTRASTGATLYLALGACMAWRLGMLIAAREPSRPPNDVFRRAVGEFWLASLAGLAFILLAAAVNYGRWGNPFTFIPLHLQEQTSYFEGIDPRFAAYGMFHISRLGLGLIYYFAPIWALTSDRRFLFHDEIDRLFSGFELPPSSFVLSDPLTLALAGIGVWSLVRKGIPGIARGPALTVLPALTFAPALIVVGLYAAFRYRVEFMPFLFLAACLGAVQAGHWIAAAAGRKRRIMGIGLAVLLGLQITSAHIHAVVVGISPFGPSSGFAEQGLPALYRTQLGLD